MLFFAPTSLLYEISASICSFQFDCLASDHLPTSLYRFVMCVRHCFFCFWFARTECGLWILLAFFRFTHRFIAVYYHFLKFQSFLFHIHTHGKLHKFNMFMIWVWWSTKWAGLVPYWDFWVCVWWKRLSKAQKTPKYAKDSHKRQTPVFTHNFQIQTQRIETNSLNDNKQIDFSRWCPFVQRFFFFDARALIIPTSNLNKNSNSLLDRNSKLNTLLDDDDDYDW